MLFAAGAEFDAAAFASAAKEFVAGVSIRAPFVLSVARLALASVAGAVDCSMVCSSTGASGLPLRTDVFPVRAGIEIISAESMNTTAAAIVSFERTDAVPRGPNAALDTLLVKRAPASVLPGCSNTAAIRTMHEMKNIV